MSTGCALSMSRASYQPVKFVLVCVIYRGRAKKFSNSEIYLKQKPKISGSRVAVHDTRIGFMIQKALVCDSILTENSLSQEHDLRADKSSQAGISLPRAALPAGQNSSGGKY